ncbi:thiolase [Durotheca rogersii]|uniref:thiolase n=1 Tax=Durotheca rogersii TaxID=419775 RepID=UPI00221FEA04|nr:thiolase [Durotheca rogersii]KAI5865054.1 thiolase [Durotheca rogersii]
MAHRIGVFGSAARSRAPLRAFAASRRFSTQTARWQEVRDAYILSASRTPTGKFNGAFLTVPAPQLAAVAIKSALEKSKVPVEKITDVYIGNVLQASVGQAPARQAVIFANLPKSVEAVTVNKVCASGLKAVVLAAQNIQLGLSEAQIAGGMENMSQVPYYVPRASSLPPFGHVKLEDGLIKDGLTDVYGQFHMGICAETTAKNHGISREAQDQYAIQSYERAQAAWKSNAFKDEIAPVTVKGRKGEVVVDTDEGYLDVKPEKIPTLKPAFLRDGTGTVTAANSSTLNDGASALVLGSKDIARQFGRGSRVLARICSSADAAIDPVDFPVAPAKAVPIALERAGITKDQVAVWEFNEAFAAVIKANEKILGLENARVNPLGGAISLGHALGSSGSRILTTLLHQLKPGEYGPGDPTMALIIKFLTSIRGFLKALDGQSLCDWLKVEPPVPQEYHKLAIELRDGYQNASAIERLVESCLPEEEELPEGQGTAWPGFNAFMKDYLEYWRVVDFEDFLGAHQLLTALTNSCTTALNNPTYGTVMLQTSISLCSSLSKLSMTLNRRPDLTKNLATLHTGEEDQKSIVEVTAEVIQKFFTTCLTDRSSSALSKPTGKKVGVYVFANVTLKLLFTCRRSHLAKQLFTNMTAKSPPLSYYPASQRVTYLYYLGRFHFINNHFSRAAQCLQEAYLQTPPNLQKHRQLILTYLIPANLLLGRLPSQALLRRPEAQPLAPIFEQLAQSIRTGNYLIFHHAIESNEAWLFRKGLLLTLTYRLRPLLWRSLSRRTFLLTYIAPTEADSRKAATLELALLLTTATYIQKRLEGYLPAKPPAPRGRPPHINSIFLKAVSNNAGIGPGQGDSTLVPPPGGPRRLQPNEGLIWGNMPVTLDHIESMVASLVAQGLLHGYIAHSQGRFAIMGTKQKGSAVAAGWPPVSEVLTAITPDGGDQEVPGWVKG